MLNWLHKLITPGREIDSRNNAAQNAAERNSSFCLESLKPRLLLSAYPVSAVFAEILEHGKQSSQSEALRLRQLDCICKASL